MKLLSFLVITALFISCGGSKTNIDALKKLDSLSKNLKNSSSIAKYTSEDGKFKIAFPGTPTLASDTVSTDAGIIEMKSFTYEKSATEEYMVAYSDYPSEIVKKSDPETILKGAKQGVISSQNATIEKEEKITLDENPGYYFTAVKDSYHMCYKIFLRQNRLYQILMLRDGAYPSKEAMDAFMGSFELVK